MSLSSVEQCLGGCSHDVIYAFTMPKLALMKAGFTFHSKKSNF